MIHDLTPSNADTKTSNAYGDHLALPPLAGVTAVNRLFVFLPGTQGIPKLYYDIVEEASSRGYHAIGLAYPDPQPVGVICASSSDQNCFWDVRQAVITGSFSQDVAYSTDDSIVTRLAKALVYLNNQYPAENWGQYLNTDLSVNWSKVVLGGHSQGGGHAGVMAKSYSVARACYFASPPDWNQGTQLPTNQPAAWENPANLSYPNLTPASVQYGFAGLSDSSVPWTATPSNPIALSVIWQTLGLAAFGAAEDIETSAGPTTTTHMLTTNATPNPSNADPGNPSHGVTVRDAFTPIDPTTKLPLFLAAWDDLCFPTP